MVSLKWVLTIESKGEGKKAIGKQKNPFEFMDLVMTKTCLRIQVCLGIGYFDWLNSLVIWELLYKLQVSDFSTRVWIKSDLFNLWKMQISTPDSDSGDWVGPRNLNFIWTIYWNNLDWRNYIHLTYTLFSSLFIWKRKEKGTGRETERFFHPYVFSSPNGHKHLGMVQTIVRSWELHFGLYVGARALGPWAMFCCFLGTH